MLYVSSQICHGRLIIFQPGADTDVWHDVFFVFVWACWRLVPHRSKLKNGNGCSWQQITFGTECWIFLWQDVGKESSLLTGLCMFLGEADGDGGVWACWRLVPHRSKLKNGKSWSWQQSRLEQNADIFFVARCWERIQFFLTGLCFFLWAWRWRWGLGLLTVGSSQVQTPNWKESVQAGNKSRLEQNAGFFFVARGWERVQSFDWAMHFCLVRLTVGPYR